MRNQHRLHDLNVDVKRTLPYLTLFRRKLASVNVNLFNEAKQATVVGSQYRSILQIAVSGFRSSSLP